MAGGGRSRRSFLRGTGATAVAVGGLTLGNPTAATGRYSSVVDLVDDFGADNTGEEPIDEILDEAVENDTKVIFPEGEYFLESGGFHRNGPGTAASFDPEGTPEEYVFNVAFVGDGDVTIRPADGVQTFVFALWGDEVHVENFRIDQTAEATNVGMSYFVLNELVVRDIVYEGLSDTWGTFVKIGPGIVNTGGTGLIENFHVPDGSVQGRQTGAWVFPDHAGDLLFKRCSFQSLADNAIYGSAPGGNGNGSVGVENCFFRNNNVSSIRLGTPGSYAKNCTIVFDGHIPEYDTWGAVTGRAAWLWSNFEGYLKNIHVVSDHDRGFGFYDYPGQSGDITVENCRFELNEDGTEAIHFSDGERDVTLNNVNVTGEAGVGPAIDLANGQAAIENLCLRQTGEERDGIHLANGTATIEESLIDVTGEPIVTDDESEVTLRNLREEGRCAPALPVHPEDR